MTPGLIVRLQYDPDIECPNDFECEWRLVSFSNRHNSYEDHHKYLEWYDDGSRRGAYRPASIGLRRKLEVGTAFLLDYYEHGLCQWSLSGEGYQCRWDTANWAGILLWEHPVKDLGAKSYVDREKDARGFVERYTKWCNGEGYGYDIETAGGKDVDSCWGFDDDEYMIEDYVRPAIEDFMAKHGFTRCEEIDAIEELLHDDFEAEPGILYVEIRGDAKDSHNYHSVFPTEPEPLLLAA